MDGSNIVSGFIASKYLIECLDITIERTKEDRLTKTILENSVDSNGNLDPYSSIIYIRALMESDIDVYLSKTNLTIKNYLNSKDERDKLPAEILDYLDTTYNKVSEAEENIILNDKIIKELETNDPLNFDSSSQLVKNAYNRYTKKNTDNFNEKSEEDKLEVCTDYLIDKLEKDNKKYKKLIADAPIIQEIEYDDKYKELLEKTDSFDVVTYESIVRGVGSIVSNYSKIFSDIFAGYLTKVEGENLIVIDRVNLEIFSTQYGIPESSFKLEYKRAFEITENNLDYKLSKDEVIYKYLEREKKDFSESDERLFFYLIDVDYQLDNYYVPNKFDTGDNGIILKKISSTINRSISSLNDIIGELNEGIERFNVLIKTYSVNLVALYYEAIFRSRLLSMDKVTKSLMKLPNTNFVNAFKKTIQDFINEGLDRILEFIKAINSVINSLDMLIQILMISSINGVELPTEIFNSIKFCPNLFDPADSVVKAAYASVKIGVEYIKCIYEFNLKEDLYDFCEEVNFDLKNLAGKILGMFNLDNFDYDDWNETAHSNRDQAYIELDSVITNLTEDQLFSSIKDVVNIVFDIILAVLLAMIIVLIIAVIIKIIFTIIPIMGKMSGFLLSVGIIYVAYKLFYNCNEYYTIEWNNFYTTYNKYIEKNTSLDDYSEDEYGNKVPYIETVNNLVNGDYKSISSYTNKFKRTISKFGFEITDEEQPEISINSLNVKLYKAIEEQIVTIYNSKSLKGIGSKVGYLISSDTAVGLIKTSLDSDVETTWTNTSFETDSTFRFDNEADFDYYKDSDSDSRKKYIKDILVELSDDIESASKLSEVLDITQGVFGITKMGGCVKDPKNGLNPFLTNMICDDNISNLNDELSDDEIYTASYCFESDGSWLCVDVDKGKKEDHIAEKFEGCFDYSYNTVLSEMQEVKNNNYLKFQLNIMEFFGIDKVIEIFSEWAEAKSNVEDVISGVYDKLDCYLNKLNDFSCDDIIPDSGVDRDLFKIDDIPSLTLPSIDINTITIGCPNDNQTIVYDKLDETAALILDGEFGGNIPTDIEDINDIVLKNEELLKNNEESIQITKDVTEEKSYEIEGKMYEKVKVYTKDLNERVNQMASELHGGKENDDGNPYTKYNEEIENGLSLLDFFDVGGKKYKDYFKSDNILSKYHQTWKDKNGNNKFYGKNVNINKGMYSSDLAMILLDLVFNLILRSPIELFLGNFPDIDFFLFMITFIKMPITWDTTAKYIRGFKEEDSTKLNKNNSLDLGGDLERSIEADKEVLANTKMAGSNGKNIDLMFDSDFCDDEDGENPCPNADLSIQEKFAAGLITTCDMTNPNTQTEILDEIMKDPDPEVIRQLLNSVMSSHPISQRILPYSDGVNMSDRDVIITLGEDDKYCI